jgi:GABA permease
MRTRAEFMAIPIVAVVLGVVFLVMLTAEAGIWGWVLFAVGAIVALAVVLLVVGRRHQHPSDLDVSVVRAPGGRDGKFRVLVVSDGSSTSQTFHEEVVARAAGRPIEVLVVAPALGSRLSHWTGDDDARHEAEGNLERTVEGLTAAGVAARGEVGSDDPIQAADDALREFPADELVFATHPEAAANWKERGVVEIARTRYDLPVTHVAVDAD